MLNSDSRDLPPGDHRRLIVWQKSMDLAVEVISISRDLPKDERFETARQMRRASISIPANIAEGKGRMRRADYARFVAIARGSARELDTYFDLVHRLAYIPPSALRRAEQLLDEVTRMLTTLLRRLNPI